MKTNKMIKNIFVVLISFLLCFDIINVNIGNFTVYANNDSIVYRAYNASTKKFYDNTIDEYTLVDETETEWGIEGEETWYVLKIDSSVSSEISFNDRITVKGTVNLILCDNNVLRAKKGISVNAGNTFRVYAQSTKGNMGKLRAGELGSADGAYAGIGGDEDCDAGTITIYGGDIAAYGGAGTYNQQDYFVNSGAGIGGGSNGNGGKITIYGGSVDSTGGKYNIENGSVGGSDSILYSGAGIGGGSNGDAGTIVINDGKINVLHGDGAGIGGGYSGDGGTITVNGGEITSKIASWPADSSWSNCKRGAGIGGGYKGSAGCITINGGNINTEIFEGAGIGSGSLSNQGMVVINNGIIVGESVKDSYVRGCGSGAGIGTGVAPADENSGKPIIDSNFEIIINGGKIKIINQGNGAGVGSGFAGNGGLININGGDIDISAYFGAGIGSGAGGYQGENGLNSNGGKINIYGGIIKSESVMGAGIGGGNHSSSGDIKIYGGIIDAKNLLGDYSHVSAAIGDGSFVNGGSGYEVGNITIYSGVVKATVEDDSAECIGKSSNASQNYELPVIFKNGSVNVTSQKDNYFYDVTEDNTRTIKRICKVTVADKDASVVEADNYTPYCYDTVTLTLDESVDVSKLSVVCDDEPIRLTKVDDTTYTFAVPEGDVNISYKGFVATVDMDGWNYGDEANQPSLGEGSNPGNGEVSFVYYIDEACTTKTTFANSGSETEGGCPKKAGTYYVKATIAATDNYDEENVVAGFTIEKLDEAPNIPENEINVGSDIDDVSNIELPEGWKWKENKNIAMAETTVATAIYDGDDKGNYETETVDISIYRECDHHTTKLENKKDPSCTQKGYTGDVYCDICGKFLNRGSDIGLSKHLWSKWTVSVPATTQSEGKETRKCSECNAVQTRIIDKLEADDNHTEVTSQGTVTTSGVNYSQTSTSIVAEMLIEKSNAYDDVEFRWLVYNESDGSWNEISSWTKNNPGVSWSPQESGNYVIVGQARVIGNEAASKVETAFGVQFHKHIEGICQMPYTGEGGGFLIGIKSYNNPNNSYKYEMLILDCNLYMQGKDAWVYTTGKCGAEENCLWTIWQPQYGYYWTLFRIYDQNDNLIDEACYGFENVN